MYLADILIRRGSSVVERVIGNDEAGSSTLPSSTIFHARDFL